MHEWSEIDPVALKRNDEAEWAKARPLILAKTLQAIYSTIHSIEDLDREELTEDIIGEFYTNVLGKTEFPEDLPRFLWKRAVSRSIDWIRKNERRKAMLLELNEANKNADPSDQPSSLQVNDIFAKLCKEEIEFLNLFLSSEREGTALALGISVKTVSNRMSDIRKKLKPVLNEMELK